MDLLGITALYIFLYVPILWICTYPVYWLNKKTKSKVNPFLMRLELQFLGSSLSSLVRVLLGGFYIIFFRFTLLYRIFLYINGNREFYFFLVWYIRRTKPLESLSKTNEGEQLPPLADETSVSR